MAECKCVFLDTSPIIYYVHRDEYYFESVKKIFMFLVSEDVKLVTSPITIAEYCVYPYRIGNFDLIMDFYNFLKNASVEILNIEDAAFIKSAQIRAEYPGFKLPDSLQLATAVIGGCDTFLTNDKQLRQFTEIKCLTIEDFDFLSNEI